jgi:hypothetical protein
MLEKMGINQFSLYYFGSKQGFLESLKCYKAKSILFSKNYKTEPMASMTSKHFFYDSVDAYKMGEFETKVAC